MSKSNISVKVKVSVLITALRKALAERTERHAMNDKKEADYKKARDKWEADFHKAIISAVKNGKAKALNAHVVGYHRNIVPDTHEVVEITVSLPKSILVEAPQSPDLYHQWEYKQDKEALENAIRVLEMSDNEVVSTSTYHSVVKYL